MTIGVATHTYGNRIPAAALRESQELRARWYGWMGRTQTTRADALRGIGVCVKKTQPKWAVDGNIPFPWADRIKSQIGSA